MNTTTVLLDAPLVDIHARKREAPAQQRIIGASVFATEFVRALVAHGSDERYYLLSGREEWRGDRPQADFTDTERLRTVDADSLFRFSRDCQPVLASAGPVLQDLRLLRRSFAPRGDWPVTGFIHSVNAKSPPMWLLSLALGDARPWDALICSSRAGRRVIENHLAALVDAYPTLRGLGPLPAIELPVIPLGSDAIDCDATRRAVTRRRLQVEDGDVVLLYLGRFSPVRKCDLIPLVAAVGATAPSLRARLRLVLAGDDTRHRMTESLLEAARDLGCGNAVFVQPDPTHEEKLDLYRAADVFVSPSDNLQETFGLAIVEALASGLPVIASDWNGYPDLVVDGDNGLLVPTYWTDLGREFDARSLCQMGANDGSFPATTTVDVGSLTRQIELLAGDRERRMAMGMRARRSFFERFHWPIVIRRYEELWTELRARAAAEADRYDVGTGPVRGVMRRTFAHYPSATLDDTCQITLGSVADRADPVMTTWRQVPMVSITGQEELARSIVRTCTMASVVAIQQLVSDACARTGATDLAARVVVARLLKYGVLRPVSPVTVDASRLETVPPSR